jgi:hypothetical protein
MFHKKNRHGPPSKPFSHADNCKILLADPGVQIEWGEIERGHWVATCVCGEEHYRGPDSPRVRNDPYDPATSRHLPQCEFAAATDPAILRALLKIRPGLDPGYQWVECGVLRGWVAGAGLRRRRVSHQWDLATKGHPGGLAAMIWAKLRSG